MHNIQRKSELCKSEFTFYAHAHTHAQTHTITHLWYGKVNSALLISLFMTSTVEQTCSLWEVNYLLQSGSNKKMKRYGMTPEAIILHPRTQLQAHMLERYTHIHKRRMWVNESGVCSVNVREVSVTSAITLLWRCQLS